jgi:REP element-mobilizing transposase RayT
MLTEQLCYHSFMESKQTGHAAGYTAHVLREEFPHLNRRLPNLWMRSYYVGTACSVSAATIQRYLDERKRS